MKPAEQRIDGRGFCKAADQPVEGLRATSTQQDQDYVALFCPRVFRNLLKLHLCDFIFRSQDFRPQRESRPPINSVFLNRFAAQT